MTLERRKKLEEAGFVVTTAEEFFGLNVIDRKIVAIRGEMARAVRRLRREQGLTQQDLATRLEVAQSRITGIERGEKVSLESLLSAYLALGGRLREFLPTDDQDQAAKNNPIAPASATRIRVANLVRRPPTVAARKGTSLGMKPKPRKPAPPVA